MDDQNNRCGGYVPFQPPQAAEEIPGAWSEFFSRQTLAAAESSDPDAFYLVAAGLPDTVPANLSNTFLEQMVWGLLSRPHCGALVQPLYISLNPGLPSAIYPCNEIDSKLVISSGFVALLRGKRAAEAIARAESPAEALNSLIRLKIHMEYVSRCWLEERKKPLTVSDFKHFFKNLRIRLLLRLKNRLGNRQKAWLKRQLNRMRNLSGIWRKSVRNADDDIHMAAMKSWKPAIPRPEIAINVAKPANRIPILMAVHWLELGGAEKFAVDLINALPKEVYAVYVVTNVPSENDWSDALRGKVEEMLFLPEFLMPHMAGIFYEQYIRTRGIRLLHIHHAPWAYESLFHLRRFHPGLKVLDSLHIIEFPPNSGGYPEFAVANFEIFIDCHHVISRQVQKFLMQRWLVPQEKIRVIYLNVDTDYFDPAKVAGGGLRARHAIPEDACLVGFIGRIGRQKRPLEFVRMAKLLAKRWKNSGQPYALHFIMAGSGPLMDDVRTAAGTGELENILHFHGEVADTRPVYKDCDLVAMPSENEGLALVSYEAMAMQTPVFFTDVGAQSELLGSEFLVSARKPAEKLAEAVWPFLVDKERRQRTGEESRQYILEHHRAEQTVTHMQALYQDLLADNRQSKR
ncbi:MAG: glycosyltransferase family 4 protein [Gammaproteobacteria bacterium]|nr:glycosyltransferase family 4 protein [Gammaproteobacteria bacterium]